MVNSPKTLDNMDDSVLIMARSIFNMMQEKINAKEISFEQGPTVLELQEEIDRIDVELLSRGLVPGGD